MEILNQTTMLLAQGGADVDPGGLSDWIGQWGDAIKKWLGLIIGIATLIFASVLIIKGTNNLQKKRTNEAVTQFVFAGLIILAGVIGIGGLFAIVDTIKPVEGTGVTDYLQ